CQQYDRFPFTF
nr:immunoglobulin light chain junction region [Macaca mulatta]MOV86075.1 immunoglobulin light chain junction region [Macaca mulatta]MOV86252.1 immunoglobulin light chain junction region [Macaca mulatta]MOV86485.1 immunoglobulin light chain junction region [Macaca mulatta]